MSMAIALQGLRDFTRTAHGWDYQNCGIQADALPPPRARQWYVAFDDAGVVGGPEATYSLKETLDVVVGIWRQPGHLPKDLQGMAKLPDDVYIAEAITLHRLERSMIVPRLGGLHQNNSARVAVNTQFALPNENDGSEFLTPLFYTGRSRMESIVLPDGGTGGVAWLGYRLRFRGMHREQKSGQSMG